MVVFSIVFVPMREKNLDFPEWLIPSNLPLEFHTDFVSGTVDFVSVFCGAFWCRVFAAHRAGVGSARGTVWRRGPASSAVIGD